MKHLTTILAAAALLWMPCSLRAGTLTKDGMAQAAAPAGQKERYQKQVEAKLRELDREIAALKNQAPRKRRELQNLFKRQMADLDAKREAAQDQLEKFKNTSQEAWRDAKPELDAALKNLEKAYKRAASDFE
jgi:predicted  nucleic acid-binding Zn-ribbon protein